MLLVPSAHAASSRAPAENATAIDSIREAEVALSTYFNMNNESFGSSRFPLVKAMNGDPGFGREAGIIWRVSGGKNVVRSSGKKNNPKRIFIYDVKPGLYGGVTACVGSTGTRNYCAVILANYQAEHFTLFKKKGHGNGVANKPGARGYGRIIPGDASTPGAFARPNAIKGMWYRGWVS